MSGTVQTTQMYLIPHVIGSKIVQSYELDFTGAAVPLFLGAQPSSRNR